MRDLLKIVSAALTLSFVMNTGLLLTQIGPYFPQDASSKGVSKTVIGFISGTYELATFSLGFVVPRYLRLFNYSYSYLIGNFLYISGYMMFGFTTFIDKRGLYIALALASRVVISFGASVSYATLFPLLIQPFPQHKGSVASAVTLVSELGFLIGPLLGTLLFPIGGFFLPVAVISGYSFTCLLITFIFTLYYQNQDKDRVASDLQNDVKTEEERTSHEELGKPKLLSFIRKPDIILASIPFCACSTTTGLFTVFLSPYLCKVLDLKEDVVGLYFTPSALVALIASPVFGCLINWKLKWFSFIVSPLVGLLASILLSCVYFIETFRSNITIIPTLLSFGFCSSVGYISGMVVLDELFQINKKGCLEEDIRVLMSSWTQNICNFLGRWVGAFLIGGLIFDYLGYEGVLITQTLLYLISVILTYLCYTRTTAKTKN